MRTRAVWLLLVGVIGLAGCAGRLQPGAPLVPVAPAPAPRPNVKLEETVAVEPAFDPASVVAAVHSVEPHATVGALVGDRTAGTELLAIEPDRQFRSASLVKLLIAIDVLEHGADAATRKRLAIMLSRSDDDIASALWVSGGGPEIVTRSAGRLGLRGTRPPKKPGRWGDVLLTAHDVARIYEYVLTELPAKDRGLIVDALANAPRQAADGWDQHFGIPDGLGGTWAIKQGWSDSPTDLVIHSSGLVGDGWRYIVVLLTEHPLGTPSRTATASVTAAAKALSSRF
jgi:hypothetical protein